MYPLTSEKFVQILDWFLKDENAQHWAAVKDLAHKDTPEAFETLKKYVLEAGRFSSFLALIRICVPAQGGAAQIKTDQGQATTLKAGEVVLCNVVSLMASYLVNLTVNLICLTPHVDCRFPRSIGLSRP